MHTHEAQNNAVAWARIRPAPPRAPDTSSIRAFARVEETGAQAPGLVEAITILKPDCPVSAALADADKSALKKIAKEASGAH